ncbi:hypothetical protein [uncultured Cellulomonas sp.]|uniref:hypothetical protein n=1 Tax=uncultured Cellulomonas sp. TaxID=189682 RepID=UPI0028E2B9E2|nr:hypothetical protein [uncultured Cellulomonas sp.]
MSDSPQDPGAAAQEGGYGYPTLEQEVTPEVLEAGAGSDGSATGSAEDGGSDDAPTPGELEADPSPVEPTD